MRHLNRSDSVSRRVHSNPVPILTIVVTALCPWTRFLSGRARARGALCVCVEARVRRVLVLDSVRFCARVRACVRVRDVAACRQTNVSQGTNKVTSVRG